MPRHGDPRRQVLRTGHHRACGPPRRGGTLERPAGASDGMLDPKPEGDSDDKKIAQVPDPRTAPIKVGVQMEMETDGPHASLGDGSKALEAKTSVYEKSDGSTVIDVQSTSSL